MYCRNCGFELKDSDRKCPGCGSPVVPLAADQTPQDRVRDWEQTESTETPKTAKDFGQKNTYDASGTDYIPGEDSGSFGWWCLGCCIPIVGLILFLVWKDTKPKSAKMAGIGALVAVVIYIVMGALSVILGIGASFYYGQIFGDSPMFGIDL